VAADPEPLATLFPSAVTKAFVSFKVGSSVHLAQLPPVLSLVFPSHSIGAKTLSILPVYGRRCRG